jgi:hypothetical protein
MTTLALNPTASELAVQLADLRARRAANLVDLAAAAGDGWYGDVQRLAKKAATPRPTDDDIEAVLDGRPLSAVPAVDVDRKRVEVTLSAAIRRVAQQHALLAAAELSTRATATTAALRDLVESVLTKATTPAKLQTTAVTLLELLDDIARLHTEHEALRDHEDVPDRPAVAGFDNDCEAAARRILQAAEAMAKAMSTYSLSPLPEPWRW